MKKQSKVLKLNKSVVSEFSIKKVDEVKGGKTGAGTACPTNQIGYNTGWNCPNPSFNFPC